MLHNFFDLMEAYARADDDDNRAAIDAEVWETYGVEKAVFILDMSGFSRLTEKRGIVHYLSMVRHMQLVTKPIVERYGGGIVKFEADNGFAWFEEVSKAIQAAVSINIAFDAMNLMTQDDLNIYTAIGIDYGRFLLVDDRDFFGAPVNTASKLGEDIAGAGEILVIANAMSHVPESSGFKTEPETYEISGVTIEARRILY